MPRLMLSTARKLKKARNPAVRAFARHRRDGHRSRHVLERHLADHHVAQHPQRERRHLPGRREPARQRFEHAVALLRPQCLERTGRNLRPRRADAADRRAVLLDRADRERNLSVSPAAANVERDALAGALADEVDPLLPVRNPVAVAAQHLVAGLQARGAPPPSPAPPRRPRRVPRGRAGCRARCTALPARSARAIVPRTSSTTFFVVPLGSRTVSSISARCRAARRRSRASRLPKSSSGGRRPTRSGRSPRGLRGRPPSPSTTAPITALVPGTPIANITQ